MEIKWAIPARRINEIFEKNKVSEEAIYNLAPEIPEDWFEWEDEYGPDEDGEYTGGYTKLQGDEESAFDSWIETFCENRKFYNFLFSLKGWKPEEMEGLDDMDIDFSKNPIMLKVFHDLISEGEDSYTSEHYDNEAYNSDPYSYYGVSPRDFV